MNAVIAVGAAVLMLMTVVGLYALQPRLERWDYRRHFED